MKDNIIEKLEDTRQQDKEMFHALQEHQTKMIPYNFSFQTMQRIKVIEQQRERKAIYTQTVIVTILGLIGIGVIVAMAGSALLEVFKSLRNHPLLTITLICCMTFFGGINLILENYFKKQ